MDKTTAVVNHIIDIIIKRGLKTGDALPPLREIAVECEVSTFTVKKALELLQERQVVETRWGSGNFLSAPIPVELLSRQAAGRQIELIGFISRARDSAHSSSYLGALTDVASGKGFEVITHFSDHSQRLETQKVEWMLSRGVKGLMIDPVVREHAPDYLELLNARNIPYVFVTESVFTQEAVDSIFTCDNQAGIFSVMEYLYELGHRRIAYVGLTPISSPINQERFQAYRRYVAAKNLEEYCIHGVATGEELGWGELRRALAFKDRLTAFVCGNDFVAAKCINQLRSWGVNVPQEISVSGFDDRLWTGDFYPALTSVTFPVNEIGNAAAVELLRRINHEPADSSTRRLFVPRLVLRDSLAAAGR